MRSGKLLVLLLVFAMAAHCGGGGGGGSSPEGSSGSLSGTPVSLPNGPTLPTITGNNVLTISVGGPSSYANEPTVSLTVGDPNGNNCQTIDNILLDSGDYGVRIFGQALNSSLAAAMTQVEVNSLPLYECIEYGDGSAVWGPVKSGQVTLGREQPVAIPIHVVGPASFNSSSICRGSPLLTTPGDAQYNGALGVGLFSNDCGSLCATSARNGLYFTCTGSSCAGTTVPTQSQIRNAVSALPTDNNGVLVSFPSIPLAGAPSASGYLILGIGTQSNNSPSGVVAYPANPSDGDFTTNYNGANYSAFLDTGSNGLFFPSSQIATVDGGQWYNPSSLLTLSATNTGYNSAQSGQVQFQVGSYNALMATSNNVFCDLAGPGPDGYFDWGLPFFLGRNIYIGIESATSTLGTGPYWAY